MAVFLVLVFSGPLSYKVYADDFYGDTSDSGAQQCISLSFGLLGFEASYERMLASRFSVLADVSYTTLIFMDEFTVSGKARVYPFGRSFFMDFGLGYSYGRGAVSFMADFILTVLTFGWWLTQIEEDHFARTGGFLLQPGLGWKIDIGKKDGFVLPISMGLDIKTGKIPDFMPYLRIGLGYSF